MSAIRTLNYAARLARSPGLLSRTKCSNGLRKFSIAQSLREKYYLDTHEWIEVSADKKTGSIGISAHAANQLGDIVYVDLPAVGLELKNKDPMGAVESVKSASDLYVPLGGKVIEANSKLEETPGLINKSPEADGWIAKLELAEGEVEKLGELMNQEQYDGYLDE